MQTSQSAQSPCDNSPKKSPWLTAVRRRTVLASCCCECCFVLLLFSGQSLRKSFEVMNEMFTSTVFVFKFSICIATLSSIARNSGHFAPVINCQRNLISKMADKNDRSQGKRIPCDFLNNLSSVDLFYEEKAGMKHLARKC